MKTIPLCWLAAGVIGLLVSVAKLEARVVGRLYAMNQATVKIEVTNGPIIYIDPTGIATGAPADADIVLLTHNHGDHQATADLQRLRKTSTVFVSSPPGVPALMQNFAGATIHAVTPGQKLTLGTIEIETVPMYNVVKTNRHPRAMNFVGYVVNVGGVRVYHAGDTERFPEMRTFSADVAMLPLGQTFTMNSVQEAVDSALDVRARIAIPIHWGNAEGTRADAEFFTGELANRGLQTMVNTPATGFALEVSESILIAEHPASQTVAPGGNANLGVQATGSGALRYQWRRNGLALAGATNAILPIAAASSTHAGDYEVIVSDANGPIVSRMARVAVETPRPGRLVNLSVRGPVRAGAPLIVGAVVAGGSKPLLVRGVGPALTAFGVTGALPDPRVEVHGDVNGRDTVVASNNDWGAGGAAAVTSLRAAFLSAGAFDFADVAGRDAALVTIVDGPRTVHVSDGGDRAGVALVEIYDNDPDGAARLVNLSARNFAGAGESTFIAGFVISGNVPKRLLIRGLGPRLTSGFGVAGALTDPKVDLYFSDGSRSVLFAANDNWAETGAAPARAAFVSAGAFDLPDATSRDAALVVTVPAGAFTTQVSGVANATGEAMIEIYELP